MRRRQGNLSDEERLYGADVVTRQSFRGSYRHSVYDPEESGYGYGEFQSDPKGEFITSDLWTGSDYSGGLVNKSNLKAMLDDFEKLPGVHELFGDYHTYGLVFHVPTVMTWPEDRRERLIDDLENLAQYSLLDESGHSELELESQNEAWDSWARSDFERKVGTAGGFDSLEVLDENAFLRFFEAMRERANEYWVDESGGNMYIDMDRIGKAITDRDIGLLLRDRVIEAEPYERELSEFLALVPGRDVPGQMKMYGANPLSPRQRCSRR